VTKASAFEAVFVLSSVNCARSSKRRSLLERPSATLRLARASSDASCRSRITRKVSPRTSSPTAESEICLNVLESRILSSFDRP